MIGAGGLGLPVALYLASAGVGALTICDGDSVDLTNLQRQIVHRSGAIGTPKAASAQRTLAGINPEVRVHVVNERVDDARLAALVARRRRRARLQRQLRNTACDQPRLCCASQAARIRRGGALRRANRGLRPARFAAAPCYHASFRDGARDETRCAVMGVFAPLVGIIGSMQAAEALKFIAGIGATLN